MKTKTKLNWLKRDDTVVYLLVGIVLLLSLSLLGPFYQRYIIEMMSLAVLALSLNFLLGFTGLLNLAHAAFFGINMYAIITFYYQLDLPFLLSVLLALSVTMCLAALVGIFSAKLTGIQFAMVTLAFGQLFYTLSIKLRSVTGGYDGIQLSKPVVLAFGDYSIKLTQTIPLLFIVSFLLLFSFYVLRRISNSNFGRALVALRANEERAKFLGYNVYRLKLQAFLISAFFSSVAGIGYLLLKLYVSPSFVQWTFTGEILLMTLLGGMGSLVGSIGGAFVLIWIKDLIASYTDNWMLVVGLLFVFIVMFLPRGLFGWMFNNR